MICLVYRPGRVMAFLNKSYYNLVSRTKDLIHTYKNKYIKILKSSTLKGGDNIKKIIYDIIRKKY